MRVLQSVRLNTILKESIIKNWERPALSNYKGVTYSYKEVAEKIAKLHILFAECDIKEGDKIALCSKNQANWGVVFLACLTFGAVAVPILHEFKPSQVEFVAGHSDSKLLFADKLVYQGLKKENLPTVTALICLDDFSLVFSRRDKVESALNQIDTLFQEKYEGSFGKNYIKYFEGDTPERMAVINYTSGTSGFSKGVMIPFRAIVSNLVFADDILRLRNDFNIVSMLPMAHMYGLMFEFMMEVACGMHIHFLNRAPSPSIILKAFEEINPNIVISVPLVVEKIYKKKILPVINRPALKFILRIPLINRLIRKKIRDKITANFGKNFSLLVAGGAPFSREAENFFVKIGFDFALGYGMTECAPLITYASPKQRKPGSCGRAVDRMQIKIDSEKPGSIAGEILVKGDNVMLGYYKNEEATNEAFTADGWMKTGDLGLMDKGGNLFIKGRSKSMILGPSGQNIYPEEIEDSLNNMPYVAESLVVEQAGKIVALVYPDYDRAEKERLDKEALQQKMEENIEAVNQVQPSYSRIVKVRIMEKEFEKTPKKSIKRFLYQTNG